MAFSATVGADSPRRVCVVLDPVRRPGRPARHLARIGLFPSRPCATWQRSLPSAAITLLDFWRGWIPACALRRRGNSLPAAALRGGTCRLPCTAVGQLSFAANRGAGVLRLSV